MDYQFNNIEYDFEQNSDEWFKIRRRKITGSPCDKIMKSRGLGVGGETYCMQIVATEIQEHFEPTFVSKAMQQGKDREPLAVEIYEEEEMVETRQVGFVVLTTEEPELDFLNNFLGISPDRLIGEDGGLEVKCPEPDQHTRNLAEEVCHSKYYDQIQMCLFVTQRKWWDLISYNPDFKEGYKYKITRNYPDQAWQLKFIERSRLCREIVNKTINKINGIEIL